MTQKSGTACCCSATQGSGIAPHPNKQQESTPMYIPLRVHARTLKIYTHNGHLCCDVLDDYEFTRF